MENSDLDTCKSLGLQPGLDNVFRRISCRRNSAIISPKSSCWFYANKRLSKSNQPFDQWLEYLASMEPKPIIKPGRRGTALYYIEKETIPLILNDAENLLDNYLK